MSRTHRTLDQRHDIAESAHDYGIIFDSREIFLSGEVDDDGDLGNKFITNMQLLKAQSAIEPIVIHQHSLGGDWACGMMIFDAILACECPIIFICHGITASMGTVIPMACIQHGNAYVVNMPNCSWMIHDGTTDITSDMTYRQSRSFVPWEDRTRQDMLQWYTAACSRGTILEGKPDKKIVAFIQKQMEQKEDWWLSAREAVEYGFADAIMGDGPDETGVGFANIPEIKKHWT